MKTHVRTGAITAAEETLSPMHWDTPSVDPYFRSRLYAIAPPNARVAWLEPVWTAGDRWQPVHRWMLYQMVPRARIPRYILQDLAGMHPRKRGRYDAVLKRYVPDPRCMINRLQWELFRVHDAWAKPYWVVQGEQGGHRYRLDDTEKRVVMLMTGCSEDAADTPAPGDLPFAPLDQRVINKIAPLDRVRMHKMSIEFADRSPDALDAEEEEEATQMRVEVWKWLETQIMGAWDSESRSVQRKLVDEYWDNARVTQDGPSFQRELEHFNRDFVTQGG